MYRKGVSALILNSKNQLLLVNLESFAPHFFAIPGGGIEAGESLEDAVYREIKEELGIEKNLLEYLGQCKTPLFVRFKTKKLYSNGVEYDGSERYFFGFRCIGQEKQITVQKGEVRSYRWVEREALHEYLLFENQYVETLEKMKEIFGNKIV